MDILCQFQLYGSEGGKYLAAAIVFVAVDVHFGRRGDFVLCGFSFAHDEGLTA